MLSLLPDSTQVAGSILTIVALQGCLPNSSSSLASDDCAYAGCREVIEDLKLATALENLRRLIKLMASISDQDVEIAIYW